MTKQEREYEIRYRTQERLGMHELPRRPNANELKLAEQQATEEASLIPGFLDEMTYGMGE